MLNALTFKEHDTPRTLLAALVGGLISLMVFSFTMVMSVLTQAGAQFSHKLLLGLVTERHHQLVLGHYLGSLLFLLINLMVPNTGDSPTLWRSIAVYLGVLMMVNCLGCSSTSSTRHHNPCRSMPWLAACPGARGSRFNDCESAIVTTVSASARSLATRHAASC